MFLSLFESLFDGIEKMFGDVYVAHGYVHGDRVVLHAIVSDGGHIDWLTATMGKDYVDTYDLVPLNAHGYLHANTLEDVEDAIERGFSEVVESYIDKMLKGEFPEKHPIRDAVDIAYFVATAEGTFIQWTVDGQMVDVSFPHSEGRKEDGIMGDALEYMSTVFQFIRERLPQSLPLSVYIDGDTLHVNVLTGRFEDSIELADIIMNEKGMHMKFVPVSDDGEIGEHTNLFDAVDVAVQKRAIALMNEYVGLVDNVEDSLDKLVDMIDFVCAFISPIEVVTVWRTPDGLRILSDSPVALKEK